MNYGKLPKLPKLKRLLIVQMQSNCRSAENLFGFREKWRQTDSSTETVSAFSLAEEGGARRGLHQSGSVRLCRTPASCSWRSL